MYFDNQISKDSQAKLGGRCSLVNANIEALAVELNLTLDQVNEFKAFFADLVAAQATAQVERGEKDMAFEDYRTVFEDTFQQRLRIKEFLTAAIEGSDQGQELLEAYGLVRKSPTSYNGLVAGVDTLKMKHDELVAAGDTRVAPQASIDALIVLKDKLILAYNKIGTERQESAKAFDDLQELVEKIRKKLRYLYELATLIWGIHDPKLMLLGFAPAKPRPGGGQPDPISEFTCEYQDPELTFTWNEPENTTSCQLIYSEDQDEWEELYAGDKFSFSYEPPVGKRWYKVRARNANGYSDWSVTIEYEKTEVPG